MRTSSHRHFPTHDTPRHPAHFLHLADACSSMAQHLRQPTIDYQPPQRQWQPVCWFLQQLVLRHAAFAGYSLTPLACIASLSYSVTSIILPRHTSVRCVSGIYCQTYVYCMRERSPHAGNPPWQSYHISNLSTSSILLTRQCTDLIYMFLRITTQLSFHPRSSPNNTWK